MTSAGEEWDSGLTDRRILIVGGAGFIGGHLAETLKRSNRVRVFDSFARSDTSGSSVLAGCEVVRGSVLDPVALKAAMEDVEIVLHLAAIAGIFTVTKKPLTTMETNLIGAYNSLKAADMAGVDRFLYSSSSEVYGPRVYLGKEDDHTEQGAVSEPRWGYAVSKLAGEFLANSFYLERGLKTCSVRYFNVYGPRQVGEGAIHNFIVSALKGEPLRIFGSGLQIRAWTYIDDIVKGTLLAVTKPEAVGKTYNIGNPATACTLVSLANTVVAFSGSKSPIAFEPMKLADVELRVPDVTLARRELGFEPSVDLNDGLRRTIDFYRREHRG